MVRRVMAEDTGMPSITQAGHTIGAESVQYTLANPSGDMYVAKAERRLLAARHTLFSFPMGGRR